jgi:hypothetical protein
MMSVLKKCSQDIIATDNCPNEHIIPDNCLTLPLCLIVYSIDTIVEQDATIPNVTVIISWLVIENKTCEVCSA